MIKNETSNESTLGQAAGIVQLWTQAEEMFADSNVELTAAVRPSGVIHLIATEPCWLTNLPSYLLGCVTPSGVVHNYLESPYEL